MAYYELFGNESPTTANVSWAPAIVVGMKFRITSSTLKLPITYSATGIQVWRSSVYTGSYTCSLWNSSSQTLLNSCSIPVGSGAKWESASFDTPTALAVDTTYIVSYYTIGRGAQTANFFTADYQTSSYWHVDQNALLGTSAVGKWNPLLGTLNGGVFHYTGSAARPAGFSFPFTTSNEWYGTDIVISGSPLVYSASHKSHDMALIGVQSVKGFWRGINLGGPTGYRGDSLHEKSLETGITQSMTEGYANPPSLCLQNPGSWRFRWGVTPGNRTISVKTKQSCSVCTETPSILIRKNPKIGLMADVSASAPTGSSWVTIGPLTITPTSPGAVWVELCNNNYGEIYNFAYFDRIMTS